MDAKRFDDLLRMFAAPSTRQNLVRALAGLSVGGARGPWRVPDESAARKRKKRKKCKGKRKCGKKCVPKSGCCTDADCESAGQVCVGNVCTCSDTCGTGHIANPETCACCRLNEVVVADDCDSDPCCSNICSPYTQEQTTCHGRALGQPCAFDAQCVSPFLCNVEHVCA